METLREFYELIGRTTSARRALVRAHLMGEPSEEASTSPARTDDHIQTLRTVLDTLQAKQNADGVCTLLTKPEGDPTAIGVDYETEELRRDLVFFEHGETALLEFLHKRLPDLDEQISRISRYLAPVNRATFVTDRDGTVNNYCGRYRSSVQSAYNAIFLSRFAQRRTRHALVLTSAPLENIGLMDLSVFPPGVFLVAGSKGRELHDLEGRRHASPLEPAKEQRLAELNHRIEQLVRSRKYEDFAVIGSGVQFKLGQTTVARQDMYSSIPSERSELFLHEIRSLVRELDPESDIFRIEDTGYDIEIIVTRSEGDRDFNKGDGVRLAAARTGLNLEGPTIVCGDTGSDVPMVEAAKEAGAELYTVFVTSRHDLKERVLRVDPRAVFVDYPDALVLALKELSEQ